MYKKYDQSLIIIARYLYKIE